MATSTLTLRISPPQERFLHAGLPALAALDDRRLEGQRVQLGHLQRDLPGLGLELAFVVAGPGIHPLRTMLITLGHAQAVGLGVEQRVEGIVR